MADENTYSGKLNKGGEPSGRGGGDEKREVGEEIGRGEKYGLSRGPSDLDDENLGFNNSCAYLRFTWPLIGNQCIRFLFAVA